MTSQLLVCLSGCLRGGFILTYFLASLGSRQLVVKWGSLAPDLQGYVTRTYVKKRESPFPRKESNDSAGPGVLVGIVTHSPSDCMRKEGQLCKAK